MTKKAYLLLILTLLLGVLLGVALENIREMRRFNKMSERMQEPLSFTEGISMFLQLTEQQLDTLKPLLDEYAEISIQHREEARMTHQAEMDSMFRKMLPYLDEKQSKIVEDILNTEDPDKPFMPWFGKPPTKPGKFDGPPPLKGRPPTDKMPGEHGRGDNPPPPRF